MWPARESDSYNRDGASRDAPYLVSEVVAAKVAVPAEKQRCEQGWMALSLELVYLDFSGMAPMRSRLHANATRCWRMAGGIADRRWFGLHVFLHAVRKAQT